MIRLIEFLKALDQRAQWTIYGFLALIIGVVGLFIIGRFGLNIEPSSVQAWFQSAASEWYALPITIVVFCVLAFLFIPQFVLIGAAVFAFGPVEGFLYAWLSTVISASVTFWTGRIMGAEAVRRYGGETINKVSSFVGRNGFFASFIVRIVPSAPFIFVNMAAGVSQMSFIAFITGAGLGIIPKTGLIAFFGGSLMALLAGGGLIAWIALAGAAVLWAGMIFLTRKFL